MSNKDIFMCQITPQKTHVYSTLC